MLPSDQQKLGSIYSEACSDGEFACGAYTGCWWHRDCGVFAGLFYQPHPLKAGLQIHGLFKLSVEKSLSKLAFFRANTSGFMDVLM